MTTDYKLTYFNARGIAEPIRYIFAYAEVPYEDVRIEKESWPELKPNTPWGQIPTLETEGQVLAQSSTIARFLARKYDLVGSTDLEAAQCDELVDAIGDLKLEWKKFFLELDPEKRDELKKNLIGVQIRKYFTKFDSMIGSNPDGTHLVGKSFTWADFYVACYLEAVERTVDASILEEYPNLKGLKEEVNNIPQIKTWIESRPDTVN
ncbi:unnamed protein product [Allacma fusca]|uniref:glutathione transferase n=1 Tax=Allacma fusca TaxID=39272 RepID=A0A8J2PJW4_9HEXA|nr:unnamed protein product [Allacma fusca]